MKFSRDIGRAEFQFVTTDPAGDIVAVGRSNVSTFPASRNAVQPRIGGGTCASRVNYPCYDVVVVKFRASDGEMIAATFFGGNGDDLPSAIDVDAQGSIYIAGSTTSRNFPRTEGAVQTEFRSSTTTAFVAKLHTSLTGALFSTYLGGNGPTRITGIAADRSGNALVTGTTDARDYPTTPGAYQTAGGSPMAFYTRVSNGGSSLAASTFLGNGTPAAIVVDPMGNAVIAGTVSGDWPVTSDALQRTRRGGADVFFTRVLALGTGLLYSSYVGGTANDQATSLAIDSNGAVYVGGVTYSTAFPGTTETLGEIGTGFVSKFEGASLAWTTPFRANGATIVGALHLNAEQNVVATGNTTASHFPTTSGAYHRCVAADRNSDTSGFYARVGRDGIVRYSTLIHENMTGEDWAATLAGGDIITLNRPPSPFDQLPASDLRRYSFTSAAAARVDCVISAASYRNEAITPGMIVTLFGAGMGPAEGVIASLVDGKIPTTLAGVRVLFNGAPAPLLYVRGDQINAVVPLSISAASAAQVRVEQSGTSLSHSARVRIAEPGVFRLGSSEFGAVLNQDGTLNTPANAATRGSIITFWATGMGPFQMDYEDGAIVGANYSSLRLPVRVTVGGTEGEVIYAGASPDMVAGATQLNIRLPANTRIASRVPIAISVGEATVSDLGYISVK